MTPHYIANADYEERNTNALHLATGDLVRIGPEDRAWPGWVWAIAADGRSGYIPKDILQDFGDGNATALQPFDPTVLAVRRGDSLVSTRQIHGWHWCRNAAGSEGWVAGYLLRPA